MEILISEDVAEVVITSCDLATARAIWSGPPMIATVARIRTLPHLARSRDEANRWMNGARRTRWKYHGRNATFLGVFIVGGAAHAASNSPALCFFLFFLRRLLAHHSGFLLSKNSSLRLLLSVLIPRFGSSQSSPAGQSAGTLTLPARLVS